MSDFETFLRWEARSRDTIDFKKAYVDMAGDVVAGLMLSQIVYWHLPDHQGQNKLRVKRDGVNWLVKTRDEWWDECRLSPREVDRARKVLEGHKLIKVKLYKFNGSPTQHIRILEDHFLELWQDALEGKSVRAKRKFSRGGSGGSKAPVKGENPPLKPPSPNAKCLKSPISLNSEMDFTKQGNGFHGNGELDFTNQGKPKTEITTKITTEITSSARATKLNAGDGNDKQDADAALLEELIANGVGRTVAKRLVRTKPQSCRRALEYLPFAEIKSSKGAWLANAIRDDYGPPPGYEQEQARIARLRESEQRQMARTAHKRQDAALREQKLSRLGDALDQLEKSQGEALAAFNEHVEKERERLARITNQLTPKRHAELLADFDKPERRLELFEAWLKSAKANFPLARASP